MLVTGCASVWEAGGPNNPGHIFTLQSHSRNGWRLPGNDRKPGKEYILRSIWTTSFSVVITKAYVSGFYIHITSSGLNIHIRESSTAKWHFFFFYKRQHKWWEACSVHIYTVIKKRVKTFEARQAGCETEGARQENGVLHHTMFQQ